jgi:dihydropteroate synthase
MISFDQGPVIMGILNVTPDSFSDGGRYLDPTEAVAHGLQLIEEGATILDVGGESTRPFSSGVSVDKERRRIEPVIYGLRQHTDVPISIDTSKAEVARAAIEVGADIINDITGLEGDPEMLGVALETEAAVCVTHMQGTPKTMQVDPHYDDVVTEVLDYLTRRCAELEAAGIEPARIAIDPGIGFGKNLDHNLKLLRHVKRFHQTERPILIGASRKGFIGQVLNDANVERESGTIAISLAMAMAGVQIIRVHNVGGTVRALKVFGSVTPV